MKKLLAIIICLSIILTCFAFSAIADDDLIDDETNQTTVEETSTEESSTEESSTEESSTEESSTEESSTEESSTEESTTEESTTENYDDKIVITDSNGEIITTYDIEKNDLTKDLRDYLQRPLDSLRYNQNGVCTITLPKGEYCAKSSLNVYSNTKLDFNGSTIYRAKGVDGAIVRFGRSDESSSGYDGYKNIVLTNAKFDADKNGTGSLVRFAHAENVQISNITFTNSKKVNHLLTFAGCNNVKVDNCTFSDMDVTEINKYNCEAIQIDVMKEEYFDKYPEYDGTPTKNVSVTNCTFKNLQRGLGSHTGIAGHYYENMHFDNNYFENVSGYAIRATAYRNSTINNNVIKNCGSGILMGSVSAEDLSHFYAPVSSNDKIIAQSNNQIKNNSINLIDTNFENVQYGIYLLGKKVTSATDADGKKFSGDFRISAVRVENNVINSTVINKNCYGIWANGAFGNSSNSSSNLNISNNIFNFSNSATTSKLIYGMKFINCENIYVDKNSILDAKTSKGILNSGAVVDNCSGIVFNSNTIKNTTNYGIRLANATSAVVSKNNINNTKNYGIYLSEKTSKSKINSNTVNKVSIGVYLNSSAVAVEINSNKISNTTSHAIQLNDKAKAVSIKTNTVSGVKGYGIYISKNANAGDISSNSLCNPKGVPIYLNKKATVSTITKNKIDITNGSINVINLNDSSSVAKINGNLINRKKSTGSSKLKVNCKNGIAINSGAAKTTQINSNQINNCKNTGIAVYKIKSKPKIQKNIIKVCKFGIQYKKGSLSGNKISKASSKKIVKLK